VKLRLPHLVALALVLAVTVPLARAADQPTRFNGDIGRRASQPLGSAADQPTRFNGDIGRRASQPLARTSALTRQERLSQIQLAHAGYVSGSPRAEAILADPVAASPVQVIAGGFRWSDAAIGAGTAAAAIFLIGVGVLILSRRHLRVAVKP